MVAVDMEKAPSKATPDSEPDSGSEQEISDKDLALEMKKMADGEVSDSVFDNVDKAIDRLVDRDELVSHESGRPVLGRGSSEGLSEAEITVGRHLSDKEQDGINDVVVSMKNGVGLEEILADAVDNKDEQTIREVGIMGQLIQDEAEEQLSSSEKGETAETIEASHFGRMVTQVSEAKLVDLKGPGWALDSEIQANQESGSLKNRLEIMRDDPMYPKSIRDSVAKTVDDIENYEANDDSTDTEQVDTEMITKAGTDMVPVASAKKGIDGNGKNEITAIGSGGVNEVEVGETDTGEALSVVGDDAGKEENPFTESKIVGSSVDGDEVKYEDESNVADAEFEIKKEGADDVDTKHSELIHETYSFDTGGVSEDVADQINLAGDETEKQRLDEKAEKKKKEAAERQQLDEQEAQNKKEVAERQREDDEGQSEVERQQEYDADRALEGNDEGGTRRSRREIQQDDEAAGEEARQLDDAWTQEQISEGEEYVDAKRREEPILAELVINDSRGHVLQMAHADLDEREADLRKRLAFQQQGSEAERKTALTIDILKKSPGTKKWSFDEKSEQALMSALGKHPLQDSKRENRRLKYIEQIYEEIYHAGTLKGSWLSRNMSARFERFGARMNLASGINKFRPKAGQKEVIVAREDAIYTMREVASDESIEESTRVLCRQLADELELVNIEEARMVYRSKDVQKTQVQNVQNSATEGAQNSAEHGSREVIPINENVAGGDKSVLKKFTVEYMDKRGREYKDNIDAKTEDDARAVIRNKGRIVTKIYLAKDNKTDRTQAA